jgi:hypothetical protein
MNPVVQSAISQKAMIELSKVRSVLENAEKWRSDFEKYPSTFFSFSRQI